jgi:crossover junction endodeoxyribonuclease RuvC
MIILGVDPGIADTGFGVIEKESTRLKVIDYGSIQTSAKLTHSARLKILNQTLSKLIKKYQPIIAGVEDLFLYKNLKTAIKVGEARGVILLTLIQNQIPLLEFTPLQIKQAVTSYGRADKTQIQRMVKLILNLSTIPQPDDAADALAIAITCANTLKTQEYKNIKI